jgi:uncharacterized membrane protein
MTTNSGKKTDVLIISGLIFLSLVPAIAGLVRLSQIATGTTTADNARFLAMLYSLMGAWQFAPGFRARNIKWHRSAGRALVVLGLIAAVTGLWLSHYFPWGPHDGFALYIVRLIVGAVMAASLVLSVLAIRKKDIANHRAWMIRAYALGLGAGTQVLTHIPFLLITSIQSEFSRTICMTLGWVINFAVAEWIIRRKQSAAKVLFAKVS